MDGRGAYLEVLGGCDGEDELAVPVRDWRHDNQNEA